MAGPALQQAKRARRSSISGNRCCCGVAGCGELALGQHDCCQFPGHSLLQKVHKHHHGLLTGLPGSLEGQTITGHGVVKPYQLESVRFGLDLAVILTAGTNLSALEVRYTAGGRRPRNIL